MKFCPLCMIAGYTYYCNEKCQAYNEKTGKCKIIEKLEKE